MLAVAGHMVCSRPMKRKENALSDNNVFLIVTLSLLTGVKPVFFDQWRKIDQVEQERGRKLGKPREKIISVQEMLDIAYKHEGS